MAVLTGCTRVFYWLFFYKLKFSKNEKLNLTFINSATFRTYLFDCSTFTAYVMLFKASNI